jgi:uncharacterized membrane protein
MAYLVLGLVLFLGIHSISIFASAWRDRTAARLGIAWRGLYSLVSIAGFILIIRGYGLARHDPVVLYTTPLWTRYITPVLMLPVVPLFLAPDFPGRIKKAVMHPMLTAVTLWAVAHLIAVGMLADVLLFGGFLLWAVADRLSYRWRTQRPIAAAPPMKLNDVIVVALGLIFYVVFAYWLHPRWIGVPALPM